jgi:uncharacterized protein YjbI with pentapeptide repeats
MRQDCGLPFPPRDGRLIGAVADEKTLAILNEGSDVWNEWRRKEKRSEADLTGANLNRAYLAGANLTRADLTGANFTGAHLDRANLTTAYLAGANLSEANLTGANLTVANLTRADLTGADLTRAYLAGANLAGASLTRARLLGVNLAGANLTGANLTRAMLLGVNLAGANLTGANLTRAILEEAIFGNTDLKDALGLDTCRHAGPSTLDFRTLANSGSLALEFLRGCGLPDKLIDYLPSLLGEAIQFYTCFISYSSKDQEFAKRLHSDLQGEGVRCWFAPEDLKIGDRFQDRIEESIRLFDKVMIILSEASVKSRWVEREVNVAREREDRENRLILFPIRVDEAIMDATQAWAADLRRVRHIGEFYNWHHHPSYRIAFERLLRDLRASG